MTIAVYPGSFDPATNGHIDIALRAAEIFAELVVAVYDAPPKNVLFSTEERVDLLREAFKNTANVKVEAFSGLLVDYAKARGAKVIVRGLRAISDFEMEFQMALLNRKMDPTIDVVCLMTSTQYTFLSSSILKEITMLGGNVNGLVPGHVADAMRRKFATRPDVGAIPRYLTS
ncbi:MAG: pantetheine-phosphate adenylyltransferase [Chloroflexi bacterium]|nr:pantetheine-phosphate adenylyltransferase [Chloroflexota bacterium]